MARRSKKADRKLLLRWIIALVAALLCMSALAIYLKNSQAPTEPLNPTSSTASHQGTSSPKPSQTPSSSEPTHVTTPTLPPNPYTAEDFGYNDQGYLTCLSGPSIPGIDVSAYQGDIDWRKVKAAGIEFAFIRVGYRGYTSGTLHADKMALHNLQKAKEAGVKIGAYFFSQALDAQEAVEEAQFALSMLDGIELDLPLVYDWEYVSESARTGAMEPDTLLSCVEAFCSAVQRGGFKPMVYFNQKLSDSLLDIYAISHYPFWLAVYTDQMTFPHQIDFWQYSNKGKVPGIKGDVDLNLYFP